LKHIFSPAKAVRKTYWGNVNTKSKVEKNTWTVAWNKKQERKNVAFLNTDHTGTLQNLTNGANQPSLYCNHAGGGPKARSCHCTSAWLTLVITPNVGDSAVPFLAQGIHNSIKIGLAKSILEKLFDTKIASYTFI